MNAIFKRSVKGKKISIEELESLNAELDYALGKIDTISTADLSVLSPAISALLLFASQSEQNRQEFQQFAAWVKKPDNDPTWSDGFEILIERIFGDLQLIRVGKLLEKINTQKTLTDVKDKKELVSSLNDSNLTGLYENKVDELNIDFNVNLLPFKLEVLDPRIVTVKPGKANEMHRHAHETVFIFLKGHGKVIVDNYENEVGPGDFALIPRWCVHQSVNLGNEDLVFLAVADFGLTGKSFMGNYSKTARLKRDTQ